MLFLLELIRIKKGSLFSPDFVVVLLTKKTLAVIDLPRLFTRITLVADDLV